MKFKNESFKILQIADTQEGKRVNPNTIDLITSALEKEKPDLVVYSGDQIWGKRTFKGDRNAVKATLEALTEPVRSRGIAFTVCFGNHDRQVGLSNKEQFEIYKELDGFIGKDTEGIDGVANHTIEIWSDEKLEYLLYLIDSNTSLKIGYDNVHQNQIDWYRRTRDEYEKRYGRLINSIVIQHIPVCEIFELLTKVKRGKKGAVRGFRNHENEFFVLNRDKVNDTGFMKESPAEPQENSGEFDAFKEKGEVLGVYFGHDHNNSFNGKVDGIDLGYTQGAGFNVYGPGKDRGVRIIELKKDGDFCTYDLRFRDIVGNKVKKPIKYLVYQALPTNTFDAVLKIAKIFGCLAIIALITLLILLLFG